MMEIHLTQDEELILQPLLDSMSQKAHHRLTLPLLIKRWENLISKVERGYEDSIYEYMNDLAVRDLLQVIIDKSSLHLHRRLVETLQLMDERFKNATKGSRYPLSLKEEKSQAWWWYRIPIESGSEFRNDLQHEGLI